MGKVNTVLEAGELMNNGTRASRVAGREGSKGQAAMHGRSPEEPTASQWGWVPEGPNTGGLAEGLSKEPLFSHPGRRPDFCFLPRLDQRPLTPRHS